MTSRDGVVHSVSDPIQQNLSRLRSPAPDHARAYQVRARCRAQLERHHRRSERAAHVADVAHRVVAPAILGVICVLYTVALVVLALGLHGARWRLHG